MKAILVVEMPTHCGECPVKCRMRGINHVPSWCPLRPLPKWKDVPETIETNRDWESWGYDQCIADILGDAEAEEEWKQY